MDGINILNTDPVGTVMNFRVVGKVAFLRWISIILSRISIHYGIFTDRKMKFMYVIVITDMKAEFRGFSGWR
jgi:hypothetical protein